VSEWVILSNELPVEVDVLRTQLSDKYREVAHITNDRSSAT